MGFTPDRHLDPQRDKRPQIYRDLSRVNLWSFVSLLIYVHLEKQRLLC